MNLLTDQDLIANLTAPPPAIPYIEGFELPADPYSKDSPVQGASVDLHIGSIYLPGKKEIEEGGTANPKTDYVLKTGETAVVTTVETLHLPGHVTGFGFPPSRVSFRGLLMTNPGHVDPGYEGLMRFTVINMAKEGFSLRQGDRIVTLLLFSLDNPVHSDWRQRDPRPGSMPSPINQANINRLSKDFVEMESRAKKIAREQGIKWGAGITAAAGILITILKIFSSGHLFYRADVEDIKKRQDVVEYDLKNRVNVDQKLQDFDNRLKDLERMKLALEQNKGQRLGKAATNEPGNH